MLRGEGAGLNGEECEVNLQIPPEGAGAVVLIYVYFFNFAVHQEFRCPLDAKSLKSDINITIFQ